MRLFRFKINRVVVVCTGELFTKNIYDFFFSFKLAIDTRSFVCVYFVYSFLHYYHTLLGELTRFCLPLIF